MKKISFKEYVASKKKLLEAVKETPIASLTYSVKKYCKIRVGESKENRQEIALKPRQTLIIEWRYDDINEPEPVSIIFEDIGPEEHDVYWNGNKLKDWLYKNAIEDIDV